MRREEVAGETAIKQNGNQATVKLGETGIRQNRMELLCCSLVEHWKLHEQQKTLSLVSEDSGIKDKCG